LNNSVVVRGSALRRGVVTCRGAASRTTLTNRSDRTSSPLVPLWLQLPTAYPSIRHSTPPEGSEGRRRPPSCSENRSRRAGSANGATKSRDGPIRRGTGGRRRRRRDAHAALQRAPVRPCRDARATGRLRSGRRLLYLARTSKHAGQSQRKAQPCRCLKAPVLHGTARSGLMERTAEELRDVAWHHSSTEHRTELGQWENPGNPEGCVGRFS
jgi:hypothetical protein